MSAVAAPIFVDREHPSLAGHFPGMPVVPGVVVLNEVLSELQRQAPQLRAIGIKKLKFLKMLLPGQPFVIEFAAPETRQVRFKCWQQDELFAEGNLNLSAGEQSL